MFERVFFLHLEIWNEIAARRGAFWKILHNFFCLLDLFALVWFGFSKTRLLLAFLFRDHSGRKQLQQPTSGVRARALSARAKRVGAG